MSQVLSFTAPKRLQFVERESHPLGLTGVRLRTLFSGISAGTELTQYRGTNPYLEKRWDAEQRLFVADRAGLEYPLEGIGYEQAGEIVEVGSEVQGLESGQLVWGSWGHRSEVVLSQEVVRPRVFSGEARLGVFARIGAIALNMVHDAEVRLGDVVAVFGLGIVGLLAAQMARLNGARVIAVDGIDKRLETAQKLGLETVDFRRGDAAEVIKKTTGRGADVSLEVTGAYPALQSAIRATAYNSKVVVGGFFQGDGVGLRLGEEFHHNRLQLICSQTSGVNPALDHRWDRLRLEQTVMQLAVSARLEVASLITHEFPAQEAARGFELLDQSPAEALQVVLDFRGFR
jgi:2-desacetyl-2-hydroxyethyl bacteriochlorophyllide A dehydrogenase